MAIVAMELVKLSGLVPGVQYGDALLHHRKTNANRSTACRHRCLCWLSRLSGRCPPLEQTIKLLTQHLRCCISLVLARMLSEMQWNGKNATEEQRSCGTGSNMQLHVAHPLLEDGCR